MDVAVDLVAQTQQARPVTVGNAAGIDRRDVAPAVLARAAIEAGQEIRALVGRRRGPVERAGGNLVVLAEAQVERQRRRARQLVAGEVHQQGAAGRAGAAAIADDRAVLVLGVLPQQRAADVEAVPELVCGVELHADVARLGDILVQRDVAAHRVRIAVEAAGIVRRIGVEQLGADHRAEHLVGVLRVVRGGVQDQRTAADVEGVLGADFEHRVLFRTDRRREQIFRRARCPGRSCR